MVGITILGRYQSIRPLGEGGMGRVFLGRLLAPPRDVVIKVMHERIAAQPRLRQTFEQEAALMSRLQHPHIVQILDAGMDPSLGPCLVMEYLAGTTLANLLRRHHCFDVERVGRWLMQLCSALHAAHMAGVVHRDLKPDNVMVLGPDTTQEHLKVMDFGLAQLEAMPHFALEKLSGTNGSIGGGTPDYLPPEQVRGDGVDHRGDIYSLGVMLFKLLTGRLPFTGKDTQEVLLAHAEKTPPRFDEVMLRHDVPPAVEAVIRNCLAKYPNERPQTAHIVAELYEEALEQSLIAPDHFPVAASAPLPSPNTPAPVAAHDRYAVVHQLEAWMPESIAVVKLRGFAEDNGGKVMESVPGMVRLRFRDPGTIAQSRSGLLSLFGGSSVVSAGHKTIMELHMQKKPTERQTLLAITVVLRPENNRHRAIQPEWKQRADELFRNLQSYLMGRA